MRLMLFAFAFLLLFPFSSARAADINEDGAQRLKAAFEKIIDYVDTVYGTEGMGSTEPLMTFEGDLQVTQEEAFYSVTWPRMVYNDPAVGKIDFGVFVFNAVADEKDGTWKLTMAIPANYTFSPVEGEAVTVNIGAQNAVGLFNEKLGHFTKLDARYENISLSGADIELDEFVVGNMHMVMNLEEDENGALSGPASASFSDISVQPSGEDISIKIGRLALNYAMNQFVPIDLDDYKKRFLKHADTFKSLNQIAVEKPAEAPVKEADGKAIMDMMLDLYGFEMDGFDLIYRLEDLRIESTNPEELAEDDFQRFSLAKAFFGLGLGGLNAGDGHLEIGLGYSGIDAAPVEDGYMDVVPQDLKFKVRAEKIPVKTLSDLGTNTMTAIAENPEMMQMAGFGMAMKLPAILSQAGTRIVIEDNYMKNALYHAALKGQITADINAVGSAVGKINGVFEGLDALYALASQNAENTALKDAAEFKDLMRNLDMLKSYGTPGTGPNGKPAYVYEFELTPQGKFLLNGQEMSPQGMPPANNNAPLKNDAAGAPL